MVSLTTEHTSPFVPATRVVPGISGLFERRPPPPPSNWGVCLFLGPLMPIDPDNRDKIGEKPVGEVLTVVAQKERLWIIEGGIKTTIVVANARPY